MDIVSHCLLGLGKGIVYILSTIICKVCIPKDAAIINSLIQEAHDSQGHPSAERTLANLSKTFWWPRMRKTVNQYCKQCATCQRIKARTTKVPGYLMPLPKPSRPWDTMSMDFISGLPLADGYDSIATFVDTFTKQAHFVPCSSKINAEELSRIYFKSIFKHHGLSRCIISDRDPLFTSVFWRDLMRQLRTKLNMSSAYHPQTDGQTERTHRTIEQILRGFIHAQHHDWLHVLPLAEFCYNNSVHSATKFSPFEALYGFNPISPPDLIASPPSPINIAQRIRDIHDLIVEELKIADVYMKHDTANRSDPKIVFKEGERVWLSTEHLRLHNQPSKKFQQKYIGPYLITSKISDAAYELELPSTMQCHNVFHISKLRSLFQRISKYAVGAVLLQKDEQGHLQPCAYYSKVFQSNQTHYPAYQQELLGIVLAIQEWRHYIEGAKKITCITDHATLRHLLSTENVNALTARRIALWSNIISPFIGSNDSGEPTFEILYRKGTENDSDALSRRPDLHHEIVKYEDLVQEKDLEIGNEFFSSMYHMQVDKDFVQQIVSSYPLDPAYGGTSIPRGTQLNDNDGLYYFGDKVCIPKNPSIINQLMYEAHSAQGHPSYERTLANLSKSFWWPRMAKNSKVILQTM